GPGEGPLPGPEPGGHGPPDEPAEHAQCPPDDPGEVEDRTDRRQDREGGEDQVRGVEVAQRHRFRSVRGGRQLSRFSFPRSAWERFLGHSASLWSRLTTERWDRRSHAPRGNENREDAAAVAAQSLWQLRCRTRSTGLGERGREPPESTSAHPTREGGLGGTHAPRSP